MLLFCEDGLCVVCFVIYVLDWGLLVIIFIIKEVCGWFFVDIILISDGFLGEGMGEFYMYLSLL